MLVRRYASAYKYVSTQVHKYVSTTASKYDSWQRSGAIIQVGARVVLQMQVPGASYSARSFALKFKPPATACSLGRSTQRQRNRMVVLILLFNGTDIFAFWPHRVSFLRAGLNGHKMNCFVLTFLQVRPAGFLPIHERQHGCRTKSVLDSGVEPA